MRRSSRSPHTYCSMFTALLRLVFALFVVVSAGLSSAQALPMLRLARVAQAPRKIHRGIHRPNYRSYKAYRYY